MSKEACELNESYIISTDEDLRIQINEIIKIRGPKLIYLVLFTTSKFKNLNQLKFLHTPFRAKITP